MSLTFALVAKVSPAGNQVHGCAAGMRLLQWLLSKAAEEQPWLQLCYGTSTAPPSATELNALSPWAPLQSQEARSEAVTCP